MSINHLSDNTKPTKYLNPNFNNCISSSLKLDGSNVLGYNATTINNYEEYENLLIDMDDEFGGQITQKFSLNIQRIGNYVNMFIYCPTIFNVINTCSYIKNRLNGLIPQRFRPNMNFKVSCICDNGDSTQHIGEFYLNTLGNIQVHLDYEKSKKFSNTKNNSFFGAVCFYKV